MTDSLKDPEGSYDVERANSRLADRAMTEEAFQERLRARDAQYTNEANRNIKKVDDVCNETDGTNRPDATVGDGTSEAALRQETSTGDPVGSRGHALKCSEAISALRDAISRLESSRRFITDPAKARRDRRVHRSRAGPHRGDGTSRSTPGFPGEPGPVSD